MPSGLSFVPISGASVEVGVGVWVAVLVGKDVGEGAAKSFWMEASVCLYARSKPAPTQSKNILKIFVGNGGFHGCFLICQGAMSLLFIHRSFYFD